MATPLLNERKDGLRLLNGGNISLDLDLPKFKIIHEEREKERSEKTKYSTPLGANASQARREIKELDYETLRKYFIDNSSDKTGGVIPDFELEVSDKMREVTHGSSLSMGEAMDITIRAESFHWRDSSLFERILHWFHTNRKVKAGERFDVLAFFANVKAELSSEEACAYRDRIKDYINCIGYLEKTSQTALKERMFQRLVVNKYESILYSKGMLRAISEKRVVEFAKKCFRSINLDYIRNYVRTIPVEVIAKKIAADNLCVFDNYVIMYYGGDKVTAKTAEEKIKETQKRRDPILFGVISGSDKLYYIDSWVDEYDDLTWDTIVKKLGEDVLKADYIKDTIV